MEKILPEFKVHRLNDDGMRAAEAVAEGFSILLDGLKKIVPPGRSMALVVTKLQEAAFWAKRGIAEKSENNVDGGETP